MSDVTGYGRSFTDDMRVSSFRINCALLARSAERWGAQGQGHRLGMIASHLTTGNVEEATALRDAIKRDRDEARINRLGIIAICVLLAGSIALIIHGAGR